MPNMTQFVGFPKNGYLFWGGWGGEGGILFCLGYKRGTGTWL